MKNIKCTRCHKKKTSDQFVKDDKISKTLNCQTCRDKRTRSRLNRKYKKINQYLDKYQQFQEIKDLFKIG